MQNACQIPVNNKQVKLAELHYRREVVTERLKTREWQQIAEVENVGVSDN